MKQHGKMAACLLLLLALCSCGYDYESRAAGTWQGDGSLTFDTEGPEGPAPFEGAERWVFDGNSAAIATVDGKDVEFHYSMTDDTLTLNDGGEVSWGVPYGLSGNTLRIGNATYKKAK